MVPSLFSKKVQDWVMTMSCVRGYSRALMIRSFLFSVLLISSAVRLQADVSLHDNYLRCYVLMHDADREEANKDYLSALSDFKAAFSFLKAFLEKDAYGEPVLTQKKMKDCQSTIDRLQYQVAKQYKPTNTTFSNGLSPSPVILLHDALQSQKEQNYWEALRQFEKYQTCLEIIHQDDPKWESGRVEQGIKESQEKIDQVLESMFQEVSSKRNEPQR